MRVVLLNDKRPERESMVRTLQQASCLVEPVSDAKGALAAIARESPHVVLLALPGTGGAELIRLLRGADASGQAYLVALIDATPGGREISAALAAGAHDFLRRPVADLELVERIKAPTRLLKWAQSVSSPAVFDFSNALDVSRLRAWQNMGPVVAEDLAQVLGQPLETAKGWPKRFARGVRGATIPLSLASDETELRVSIVVDPPTQAWLSGVLLGDPNAGDAAIEDVLRELANTAGGAVKRAALPENITLTTGMPVNDSAVRFQGEGFQSWTVSPDGGKACIAIVGEIRKRENQRVPASKLREGMVLVHDLRSESGALLVTAGSRLTSTTAARLAQMLGERFLVEVACAA
jgi:CheY-like chemotaxis protein